MKLIVFVVLVGKYKTLLETIECGMALIYSVAPSLWYACVLFAFKKEKEMKRAKAFEMTVVQRKQYLELKCFYFIEQWGIVQEKQKRREC